MTIFPRSIAFGVVLLQSTFLSIDAFVSPRDTMLSTALGTRATSRLLVRTFSSFTEHSLNCENTLKKEHEGESLSELSQSSIQVLQGIGPIHSEAFDKLGIRSIQDLANYKFYRMAKAIAILAQSAEGEFRPTASIMNINKGVDKAFETKSFKDICEAPVAALQGISDEKGALLSTVGATTVADLASLKYCQWAESIVELSKFEE
jgi:predicted RecB family nuclease